ncbi:NERD domain-containing protein [Fictibacillus sp. 23RED33]|uniref:nuclease-related domain-containing protein n=1 Tax=Fictibacillus sp. 23RED33 TaxID=2745879 RepID=UPI0018CDA0F0|nr:NERD domain-containing protein [Fictibacillus sp. 23RED33]
MAGHNGEKSLQYFYRYLPKQEADIIHNIRIKHMEFFFQIDTLIITSKFLIVLEIKNYTGELSLMINMDNSFGLQVKEEKSLKTLFNK